MFDPSKSVQGLFCAGQGCEGGEGAHRSSQGWLSDAGTCTSCDSLGLRQVHVFYQGEHTETAPLAHSVPSHFGNSAAHRFFILVHKRGHRSFESSSSHVVQKGEQEDKCAVRSTLTSICHGNRHTPFGKRLVGLVPLKKSPRRKVIRESSRRVRR
jgi:hypothetical protein